MTIRTGEGAGQNVTIDTTGMTFIAVFTATVGAQTLTDSQSNTWTALTSRSTSTGMVGQWRYVRNPTTNASHTFTQPQAFSSIYVFATDELDVSSDPLDVQNGAVNNSAVTTLAVGSVTTTQANTIILAGIAHSADSNSPTSAYSVDNSFTLSQDIAAVVGSRIGGAIAHRVMTSVITVDPAFSWTNGNPTAGCIAAFKAPASGISGSPMYYFAQQ